MKKKEKEKRNNNMRMFTAYKQLGNRLVGGICLSSSKVILKFSNKIY